jgi:hypothetical protein
MIEELLSRIFADRNAAHTRHWATTSYAEHVCLGAFYLEIIDAADALAEAYMGMYSTKLDVVPLDTPVKGDIEIRLQDTADFLEENRDDIAQGSPSISNLIDNLTSVYTKTVFLLSLK